jgi:hypothetical protein
MNGAIMKTSATWRTSTNQPAPMTDGALQQRAPAAATASFDGATGLDQRQRQGDGDQARECRKCQAGQTGALDRRLACETDEISGEAGYDHCRHRGDDEDRGDQDQRGVGNRFGHADGDVAAWRYARVRLAGGVATEAGQDPDGGDRERNLPERQRDRARGVEIEAQCLVDRDLQRGRRRTAAERQHDREGGDAQHEDESGDARQCCADRRPFDEAKRRTGAHAELARQPPLVGRHRSQRFQEKPGGERQVEKHMRNENAGQAVNARPASARQRR